MAKIPLDIAMQDESYFFKFLLNSPRHGVVLHLITGAMQKYHQDLHAAVKAHDVGLQQDIALITRFLKREATDRVNIRTESLMINSFERLHGDKAVEALLAYQRQVIADLRHEILGTQAGKSSMVLAFENAGVTQTPSWGIEAGRTNIEPLASLRVKRHEVFNLTREMHRAYHRGERQESWRFKLRSEGAQCLAGKYAQIASNSCAMRMIKAIHGEDEAHRVLERVKTLTRLPEYEAMRNDIQATKFNGRIYNRSARPAKESMG